MEKDRVALFCVLGVVMCLFLWDVRVRELELKRLEDRLEWVVADSELRISLLERQLNWPIFSGHLSSCGECTKDLYCDEGARILREEMGGKR